MLVEIPFASFNLPKKNIKNQKPSLLVVSKTLVLHLTTTTNQPLQFH